MARGCHQLIRQGAKLVETGDDIVAELAPLAGQILQNTMESSSNETSGESFNNELADEYVELRNYIGHDPIGIDELAQNSGLTIEQVSSMLLILELHGEIESLSGGRYVLTS